MTIFFINYLKNKIETYIHLFLNYFNQFLISITINNNIVNIFTQRLLAICNGRHSATCTATKTIQTIQGTHNEQQGCSDNSFQATPTDIGCPCQFPDTTTSNEDNITSIASTSN